MATNTLPPTTAAPARAPRGFAARRITLWDGIIIGIVCFFLGAGLMMHASISMLQSPWQLGGATFSYFSDRDITHAFHRMYHDRWWKNTVLNTFWMGTQTMQTPLDLWVMQEILHETKPDFLLETGTRKGGGAMYYASLMDLMDKGRVLTVDIEDLKKPAHPRVQFFHGSSTDASIVNRMKAEMPTGARAMVVLDSDHAKEHVLNELDMYAPLVCQGCYLVVQDTHLNHHPVFVPFSPGPGKQGPMEALDEWLPRHPEFVIDASREKYGLTFNPKGWLKRVR